MSEPVYKKRQPGEMSVTAFKKFKKKNELVFPLQSSLFDNIHESDKE